jgi:hypothetical protein
MDKKYSALVILIICAVIFNCIVLSILVPPPSSQETANTTNTGKLTSKVIANIIPTSIPLETQTPLTESNNITINTDKLLISKVQTNLTAGTFLVLISNYNTSKVTITNVFVNDCPATLEKAVTVPANSNVELLLTLTDHIVFAQTYQIRLLSSEGPLATFYEIVC